MSSRFLNIAGAALCTVAVAAVFLTTVRGILAPPADLGAGVIRPAAGPVSLAFDPAAPIQPLLAGSQIDSAAVVAASGPFDRFLLGDQDAISAAQKRGYQLFVSLGCTACHQGRDVGGNMVQPADFFADPIAGPDRFERLAGTVGPRVLVVASLRDVANNAPYFHDGSIATLAEAVQVMARTFLGRPISAYDVEEIVAFLHSLSGPPQ